MIEFDKLGNLSQIASIKEVVLRGGFQEGLTELLVKNGTLAINIETGRTFDIGDLSFNGVNYAFTTKNGAVSPFLAYTNAHGYMTSFSGGFLFTAGLDNIGTPTEKSVQHGRASAAPAIITRKEVLIDEDGEAVVILEGEVHQTALFGENLVLKRRYKIRSDNVIIEDEIINKAFRPRDVFMLYHFNLGYPILDEGTTILTNSIGIVGRDEASNANISKVSVFEKPAPDFHEQNYTHTYADPFTEIRVENKKINMGARFTYSNEILKYFLQWKNSLSCDYALGIEPSTSRFSPNKTPISLEAGKSIKMSIKIEFYSILNEIEN
jgi:hypothetical protein